MSRGLNAKAEWVTFLAGTTTGANATQIGIVATKVGLSVDAIRFYERNALMPPPARTQGGFRRDGERDLSCRLYPGSAEIGLPPVEMVRRAVVEAREGNAS
jgi:hypothetical protein